MARKRYTAEEIIGHLRTIEIETGKGTSILDACRKLGITDSSGGGASITRGDRTVRWGTGHRPQRPRTPGSSVYRPD